MPIYVSVCTDKDMNKNTYTYSICVSVYEVHTDTEDGWEPCEGAVPELDWNPVLLTCETVFHTCAPSLALHREVHGL